MNSTTGLRGLAGLVMGALLGAGLYVSGMTDPGKVLGFLDVLGSWNPALMGVLGGAVIISLFGFQFLTRRMSRPWLESQFHTPNRRDIDGPLVIGTLLFGIGWGLVGYCPGPALVGLALGNGEAPIFLLAMLAGGVVQKRWGERNKQALISLSPPRPQMTSVADGTRAVIEESRKKAVAPASNDKRSRSLPL